MWQQFASRGDGSAKAESSGRQPQGDSLADLYRPSPWDREAGRPKGFVRFWGGGREAYRARLLMRGRHPKDPALRRRRNLVTSEAVLSPGDGAHRKAPTRNGAYQR